MSYQVLARKWRPQRFDDVVGQQAVTRTLRNAMTSGRIAQAFVFAGPRGCGKTTTARILARALNCENGTDGRPVRRRATPASRSRRAATSTCSRSMPPATPAIDNIREVVIAGLAIAPVRDRYKVFIIDEVHQLSPASFNALLKSIEEPPAARRLHDGHDRAAQDPRHHPVALAGVRVPHDPDASHRRAAADDRRRRADRGVRRGAGAHRARRRRQHARRAERLRPGAWRSRARRSASTTSPRCSAWWAATCCSI